MVSVLWLQRRPIGVYRIPRLGTDSVPQRKKALVVLQEIEKTRCVRATGAGDPESVSAEAVSNQLSQVGPNLWRRHESQSRQ